MSKVSDAIEAMEKATKGPWDNYGGRWDDDFETYVPPVIYGKNGRKHAHVIDSEGFVPWGEPWDSENIDANAALVCAAPDMAALLKRALPFLLREEETEDGPLNEFYAGGDTLKELKSIIAEIKGGGE